MTHRQQNYIDRIIMTPCVDKELMFRSHCIVHLRENDVAKHNKNACLTFDYLGENTARLLNLFYNSKDKTPAYSLGFIPKTDSEARIITDDTVRSITAALECEYSANPYLLKENDKKEIATLIDAAKGAVKDYRKQHKDDSVLTNDTYNSIFSDIDRWDITANERFCALFNKYKGALQEFFDLARKFDENDIKALVAYRNHITHGNYCEITDTVIRSARFMKLIIYCSLLNRLGIPYDKLKDMMFTNIID